MGKLMSMFFGVSALALGAHGAASAQDDLQAMLSQPRPIEAVASPWIEDLTWMEVRDRIADGATTAIIPTGGIEQNGPYLETGKHNVILEGICPVLAAELGNALCAPVVGFVPEGSIEPPSGLMLFSGTISVRQSTYVALLTDIASSLRQHGFTDIVLIGDSGGNQTGMKEVAETLNAAWEGSGDRVHFIVEFYEPGWTNAEIYAAEELGVEETERDGLHDDIYVTSMMMAVDPRTVRHAQRIATDRASINGVDISDVEETALLGQRLIEFRAREAAKVISEAIAAE